MPSVLSLGSTGSEVVELQTQLTELGYGSYLQPFGIDGKFGEATREAVTAFHSDVGITEFIDAKELIVGERVNYRGKHVYGDPMADTPMFETGVRKVVRLEENLGSITKHPIRISSHLHKYNGWVDRVTVEPLVSVCGPLTWEALRKALDPDPPSMEPEMAEMVEPDPEPSFTTEEDLYIINLVTDTIIGIPVKPDEVSDSVSVNFESQLPRGRSVGYVGYTSTESKEVTVTINLHQDLLQGESLESRVNKFKALEYPEYEAGALIPPNCYVSLYKGIRFTALCKSCDVRWHGDIKKGTYTHANITLSFKNVSEMTYTASVVEISGNNN